MARFFIWCTILYLSHSSILAQTDSLIQQFMTFSRVPGLFVGVVRGDSVLFQTARGWADKDRQIPMSETTCMELGSISKALTAEAIWYLHSKGKLDLNDPVRKYLPDAPETWSGITLQHLMSHTSGILNYLSDPRFKAGAYFLHEIDESTLRFFQNLNPDTMTRMFYSLPLEFEPGVSWSYSNTGFYLLGKIGEMVSGKPFFDLVQEVLTDPIGMGQTRANEKAAAAGCLAQGYFPKDSILAASMFLHSDYAFSAGAWATTGADMIRFLKAIHRRNLPSDIVGFNWRIPPTNDPELPYTYNGGRFYTTFHGNTIISHNGGTPGFSSSWVYVVEQNISVIILMNRQDYAPIDQFAWQILSCFEPLLQYPDKKISGVEADSVTKAVMTFIEALKMDTPFPPNLSKPLQTFLSSDNGKGYWRWYFEKGFPATAICVDKERIGETNLYRYLLPLSEEAIYQLAVLQNNKGEIVQIRWW